MTNLSSLLQLPFYFQYNKLQVFLAKHLFNYSFRNIKPVIILTEGAETEIKLSWAHVFSWQLVISWMEKTPVQWGILIIMFQISPLIYFTVFKHIYRWKAITFKASHHSLPQNYGEDVTSSLIYHSRLGLHLCRECWLGSSGTRGHALEGTRHRSAPSLGGGHLQLSSCSALGIYTLVKIKIFSYHHIARSYKTISLKQLKKIRLKKAPLCPCRQNLAAFGFGGGCLQILTLGQGLRTCCLPLLAVAGRVRAQR